MSSFTDRLCEFMKFKNLNDNQLTIAAGLSNGLIGKAKNSGKAISFSNIEKVLHAYPELSADWLITGRGEMLKQESSTSQTLAPSTPNTPVSQYETGRLDKYTPGTIPLVSAQAVGGFSGSDFSINDDDVIGYYVIPGFQNKGIDFMIRITGDSMAPRLWGGDIIACSIIRNPNFIQWNKTHLIATRDQGLLVKRLRKSTDSDCILAVSNNPDYDPFDIPKQDILGIARVVGVIHLE